MKYAQLAEDLVFRGENGQYEALHDAFAVLKDLELDGSVIERGKDGFDHTHYDEAAFETAHLLNKRIRKAATQNVKSGFGGYEMVDLVKSTLHFDAPFDFDCAIRYAEFEREPKSKFYEPRRKQLLPVAQAMQRLEERKIHHLGVMLPPGTGKTTMEEMFVVWSALRHPDDAILIGSHSRAILQGMYEELLRFLDPSGEYLWREIFPHVPLVGRNAKNLRIDLGRRKRFDTIEFGAKGENLAGKVRATNMICLDDLVERTAEALNYDRLEKLWYTYTVDYAQRVEGDCVELIVGTPWSINDPIDRLELLHANDPDYEFIHLPALDENDESNFDYPYHGYSTKRLHELRELMDDASFSALYMTRPIERDGVLYPADELRRYFELPDEEPDAIFAVCDTKTTGKDYCVLPVVYQYGTDFYVEDVVCEDYAPNVVENSVVNMLIKHNPHMARFESNVAGGKMAQVVQERIKEAGCRTKITTKWTQANKETKIQVESPWVLQHCLFKDDSVLKGSEYIEYRTMLRFLTSYSLKGQNIHDDVPDAMAQLSQYIQRFAGNKMSVKKRWF